jgi:two-component system, LytTR family, response regulator
MPPIYKCLIAEDNLVDRDAIEMHLSKIDTLSLEAVCSNGLEAAVILQRKEIDIVFSDINMPGLSGVELVQSLKKPPVFIFVSSYKEYAAESYNLDVIDFIVKPVTLARLVKAADKAIEYIELKTNLAHKPADTMAPITVPTPASDHFFIKENGEYIRITIADLVYVESMGNFSRLYLLNKQKHVTLVSLKNMELQLPAPHFMRVHKQYIINLAHLLSLSPEGKIYLSGDYDIPIGDSYRSDLVDLINRKTFIR